MLVTEQSYDFLTFHTGKDFLEGVIPLIMIMTRVEKCSDATLQIDYTTVSLLSIAYVRNIVRQLRALETVLVVV